MRTVSLRLKFIGEPSRECYSLGWRGLDRPDADRTVSPPDGSPEHRRKRRGVYVQRSLQGQGLLWFGSPRPDARAQAARSDPRPVGGIVRLSVGRHRGRLGVRCVRPPRTTLGRTPAHSNGAHVERAPGLAGRAQVGVPCQPPPVPPNATTSTRAGLRAPVQAAHRPPSRDRRRRDNDRPVPPGPACNEGGF